MAADFFGPPDQLPDGDLVVLSRILHDWEEARGLKLIKTIYDKLPAGDASLARTARLVYSSSQSVKPYCIATVVR